jgi:alkanesulfonate monooxygenase SsuD/methylene tetrahydromethanopterin reductase-like flavin-dependent oxidoreductase (luciferase family)
MTGLARGLAAPCFGDDPGEIAELAVAAEDAGFDGFFVWDHMLYANDGRGPALLDPWVLLSVIADRTSRIVIGPMVTPPSRRRPWVLARQAVTLDLLAGGRTVVGVGLGSPPEGDFGRFGEVSDARGRADLLDETLVILDGLWSGETFSHAGEHYRLDAVRFLPRPVTRPRIPVWVGGIWPGRRPMRRAARWDGAVPITYVDGRLTRPRVDEIAAVRDLVRAQRGTLDDYTIAVWAEVAEDPSTVSPELAGYAEAGATWWIETAVPGDGWQHGLRRRIALGP